MKTGNKAAFARPWSKIKQNPDAPEQVSVAQSGMTLREYYAGQAMQGICVNAGRNGHKFHEADELAKEAVKVADALIRALGNEA